MYGTETEPGQVVPTLTGEHPSSVSHSSDHTVHQVVDTTEGKTETRDPDTETTDYSSSAAPPTPSPQPLQLGSIKKILPPGCSRVDASGACIGLCLVVVVVHLVVGGILLGQPGLRKVQQDEKLTGNHYGTLSHIMKAGTLAVELNYDSIYDRDATNNASWVLLQHPTLLVRYS